MGVERLRASLGKHRLIAFDTCVFIYHLEANAKYVDLADSTFSWLDSGGSSALTSTVTMTELLVKPFREGTLQTVGRAYALLSSYPKLQWISPSLEIAMHAARIRADHGLKTPDALQAATAIHARATAFITNDPIFQRVKDFDSIILDEYL